MDKNKPARLCRGAILLVAGRELANMTTQRLDPHYHPIHWPPSAIALLSAAILLVLSATIYVPPRMESLLNAASRGAPTLASPSRLPFTVEEVHNYFAREIGTAPEQFG